MGMAASWALFKGIKQFVKFYKLDVTKSTLTQAVLGAQPKNINKKGGRVCFDPAKVRYPEYRW